MPIGRGLTIAAPGAGRARSSAARGDDVIHEERARLQGDGRQGQHAPPDLRRVEARRRPRLEDRADRPRDSFRRFERVRDRPADGGPRRRRCRSRRCGIAADPVGREGPPRVPLHEPVRQDRSGCDRRSTRSSPRMVGYRGIDGFWKDGFIATSQVPKEVVLGILAKADRKDLNQRLRVAQLPASRPGGIPRRRPRSSRSRRTSPTEKAKLGGLDPVDPGRLVARRARSRSG